MTDFFINSNFYLALLCSFLFPLCLFLFTFGIFHCFSYLPINLGLIQTVDYQVMIAFLVFFSTQIFYSYSVVSYNVHSPFLKEKSNELIYKGH